MMNREGDSEMKIRKLRLSVLDLVPVLEGADASYALGQAVELARMAERLGYRRYWVAEHHDMPGLACTSPEVLLAHVGARTESIRLGSGALLLPHYKPLKAAESFHMLASLYPGRIDIGLGRVRRPAGGGPPDSARASAPMAARHEQEKRGLRRAIRNRLCFRAVYERFVRGGVASGVSRRFRSFSALSGAPRPRRGRRRMRGQRRRGGTARLVRDVSERDGR